MHCRIMCATAWRDEPGERVSRVVWEREHLRRVLVFYASRANLSTSSFCVWERGGMSPRVETCRVGKNTIHGSP